MNARPRLAHAARATAIGAAAFALALGAMTAAQALWSDNRTASVVQHPIGKVAFGVSSATDGDDGPELLTTTALDHSLEVRVPGHVIARALEATGVDPEWVIWPFQIHGRADGVAAMEFSLVEATQSKETETVHTITDGAGSVMTVLGHSTVVVYPAGLGGDCSNVPEVDRNTSRNVHVVDEADTQGVTSRGLVSHDPAMRTATQHWCAAIMFNHRPDEEYVADGMVSGVGANDTSSHFTFDQWRGWVHFPPQIPATGLYGATSTAEGGGEDGSLARDRADWYAPLHPDPAHEPDLVLIATPRAFRPGG